MKDYGEPWSQGVLKKAVTVTLRDGREGVEECRMRAVDCVNSLTGVPDSWLEKRAAAKAMLAWKLIEEQNELRSREFAGLNNDGIIKAAVMFRKRGADFGELNALIDSFKEEA